MRRAALAIPTLILISFAVYVAIRLAPGGPAFSDAPEARPLIEAFAKRHHADEPILTGYARWLRDLSRLDFGVSLAVSPERPVTSLVADALPYTLLLGALAFGLTLSLAIPVGVLIAWRPRAPAARIGTGFLYTLHALPVFWIALLLQQGVAGRLGLLPALGPAPDTARTAGTLDLASSVPHWILPTLALSLGSLAFVIRFCRTSLIEGVATEFARAARARGASEARVLWRHALANTTVPLISLAGLMLPGIVSGSVLIESIFALPGLGRLLFLAASRRDYPVVMCLVLLTASATLIAQLVADMLYRAADPRVRIHAGRETDR